MRGVAVLVNWLTAIDSSKMYEMDWILSRLVAVSLCHIMCKQRGLSVWGYECREIWGWVLKIKDEVRSLL